MILVKIRGTAGTVTIKALLDSGCDATVIPSRLARMLGITPSGNPTTLVGFQETSEAQRATADISFLGRVRRLSEHVANVPVLVVEHDDGDVVLGIEGIFDTFDILFAKSQNRIVLKRTAAIMG